jgi:hypothetical protein
MEALRLAINDAERGEALINMRLCTLGIDEAHHFMVSDWPMQTAGDLPFLGHSGSYILTPASPHRLFVAAPSDDFVYRLAKTLPELVVKLNYTMLLLTRLATSWAIARGRPAFHRGAFCDPGSAVNRAYYHSRARH